MRTGSHVVRNKESVHNKNKNGKSDSCGRRGKLYVVGIGPGDLQHITFKAREVIRESDVIIGYKTYIKLIKELIPDKEVICSAMTREIERCAIAVDLTAKGKIVSLISSGDAGIYGMAGPAYEIIKKNYGKKEKIQIEIIPGVSSVNAAASCVGAPLMNDFALISLSDLLTPWEVIEKRITAAAAADFVIVFINPKSKTRTGQIKRAKEILVNNRRGDSIVGIARNVKRDNESLIITTLDEMLSYVIDMATTVIIGNSATVAFDGVMVTARGYNSG